VGNLARGVGDCEGRGALGFRRYKTHQPVFRRSGFNPTGALGSYLVVGINPDLQRQNQTAVFHRTSSGW